MAHLTFPQIISLVKDIITGIAVPITVWIAYQGLSTWRKQLQGNADLELSRLVLRSVYKFREAIIQVRSPGMFQSEINEALEAAELELEESDRDYGWKSSLAVYHRRMNYILSAKTDLDTALLEAEAMWDKEIRLVIKPLYDHYIKLYVAIRRYHYDLQHSKRPNKTSSEEAYESMSKCETIMLDMGDEDNPDEYGMKLTKIIEEIEKYIRPKMKREHDK